MADKLKTPPALKLTSAQEIESVRFDVSDNGLLIINYSIYTPSKAKSESKWDEHIEVFDDCSKALFRISELYMEKLKKHKNYKNLKVECK